MPSFVTPGPIRVSLKLSQGTVRITANTSAETFVEVTPTKAGSDADRKAAEQTRVEFSDGELLIRSARQRSVFGGSGSVEVTVALPAGSRVSGDCEMVALQAKGGLDSCEFTTEYGEVRLERAGRVQLDSGLGDIEVDDITGGASVRAGSGAIRLGTVAGPLTVNSSNGAIRVQEVTGPLTAASANGHVAVDVAHTDVTARVSKGDIRVGEAVRGRMELITSAGEIEVGVRRPATAWLDVRTRDKTGTVHNSLGDAETFDRSGADLEVHALTSSGDVLVHHA
ncbi:DUF4097 family beta strand repeat-containing protein [Streptomyces aurantiogriseus]|uniref:DUF4097 domain-containing protein n=1 Tax=Streptomyces aurantiogriseus TaxID=66870 RepID=A0A918FLL9_9ACTN|nr:DUF4097 family beta strand repeat-containing protein [Streptomyces aurantiogriseus]GGR52170.1 hypothetical protein GCM10010251_81620 [Streptomyces aurantiogriseus]